MPPPIIIIKKKSGHGGHHGGAWKVAYADFVTAMMALFIVLWPVEQQQQADSGGDQRLLQRSQRNRKQAGNQPCRNRRKHPDNQAGHGDAQREVAKDHPKD
jgi:flagellar motor protein MotB